MCAITWMVRKGHSLQNKKQPLQLILFSGTGNIPCTIKTVLSRWKKGNRNKNNYHDTIGYSKLVLPKESKMTSVARCGRAIGEVAMELTREIEIFDLLLSNVQHSIH